MRNSRREFLKKSSQAMALLAITWRDISPNTFELKKVLPNAIEINPFIVIDEMGKIILYNGRPDMGQGTQQSIPLLIAEELEVPLDQVEIRSSDGTSKYGPQSVGGSASIRTRYLPMRKVGAAVKELFLQAAANKWNISVEDCFAKQGMVFNAKNAQSFKYAELVQDASQLPIPKDPKLKDPSQFNQIGKSIPRPEIPSKVNGSAQFGIDARPDGLLYACVVHPPMIHAKVKSFDDTEARKVSGVKHIIRSERKLLFATVETVAVVADTYWHAKKAASLVKVNWDPIQGLELNTNAYFAKCHDLKDEPGALYEKDSSDNYEKALSISDRQIQAVYETPFLSHSPIEPINATVWVKEDNTVEVWAPVQGPDNVIRDLSKNLEIPQENILIHALYMGGSFGRKAYYDFISEVAHISNQIKKPVQLIWTREDDTQQGPFRPGMVSSMKAGLANNGNLLSFEHKVIGASIQAQAFRIPLGNKPDSWALEGATAEDSPYEFTSKRFAFSHVPTDIPIVWWRSVYGSTTVFGQESFIDEIAHELKKDPLDFRASLLTNQPRFLSVLRKLESISDYQARRRRGEAIGIAIARTFGSIAAQAVIVENEGDGIKIKEVFGVIDCGIAINPDNVKAQTEGNIIMGLTAAIKDRIDVINGEVQQTNFHQYQVLRMAESPKITLDIIQSEEVPGGVGEPGLPPTAPALANAVFIATGKRVRKLPFIIDQI